MPKPTFFNLTKEKQEQIINAGISEFSQSTFNEVKISSIINKAKIPRSSFYDYFIDKMDLYKYIISIIKEEKMEYMKPVFEKNQNSFFEKFREFFKAGAKFASEKPEYEKLMYKMYDDMELLKEILGVEEVDVSSAYKSMLIEGINNGDIREDIDVDFVSKSLYILSSNLMIDEIQNRKSDSREFIEELADKIIEFIKGGIAKIN